ncbi:hypothetical protein [Actinomadura nitritigenes]|uniref:hypothetical protein n=1 Tax=Actinomadura nitritigenes TaxID=134602 RepID=UPI003D8D9E73
MAVTAASLVDGDREMILAPRADVRLQQLDAPFPAVREEADEATDDDGTDDQTEFFGARACAVKLLVLKGPRAVEDELSRFSHPRTRPYLVVSDDEWSGPRRLKLRADQQSAPIGVDLAPSQREIQAQWKCPDAVWEAVDLVTEVIGADVTTVRVGFTAPLVFPLTLAATTSAGATQITNIGAVPSHFVARLYGPCVAPSLINESTGEEITFQSTLALAAGEYVEVSTRDRSAFLLSDTSQSRLGYLDFAATSWFRIEPGDSQVRYVPSSADAGASAEIDYRPSWL